VGSLHCFIHGGITLTESNKDLVCGLEWSWDLVGSLHDSRVGNLVFFFVGPEFSI
jgi:hypothetical protein